MQGRERHAYLAGKARVGTRAREEQLARLVDLVQPRRRVLARSTAVCGSSSFSSASRELLRAGSNDPAAPACACGPRLLLAPPPARSRPGHSAVLALTARAAKRQLGELSEPCRASARTISRTTPPFSSSTSASRAARDRSPLARPCGSDSSRTTTLYTGRPTSAAAAAFHSLAG